MPLLGLLALVGLLTWALLPSPPAPGMRRTPGGQYWGVDSVATLSSRLSSVQASYGATPSFWGRYLSDCTGRCGGNLSRPEAQADLARGIRLLLVVADRQGSFDLGSANGRADGEAAVHAARALGVPKGVAVFKDLEAESRVNAAYVLGFFHAIARAGYSPGFYLNAEEGVSGGVAYCRAVHKDPSVQASYLWASESEPGDFASTPPEAAPAYAGGASAAVFPGCRGRRIVWQYSESDLGGVDEDEATTLAPFWGVRPAHRR